MPNAKGDWINQRGDEFENYLPLAPDKKFNAAAQSFFVVNSRGFETGRDAWVYNFSRADLEENIQTTIDYYNTHTQFDVDPTKIVWNTSIVARKNRQEEIIFDAAKIFDGMYRPFCKEKIYCGEGLIHRRGQMDEFFPSGNEENLLICVSGLGGEKNFSSFISKKILDLNFLDAGTQCFSRYWYEAPKQGNLFADESKSYIRRDNISDYIKNLAAKKYGISVLKKLGKNNYCTEKIQFSDEIFYYVYGFLHLKSYREKFSAELKKSLPRIFLVDEYEKFKKISAAGRELAEIHLNYEKFDAPPEVEVIIEKKNFFVKKMRLSKDKTTLIYNEFITIKNIPARSLDYVVNGRSPLEWIIDRYQVKVDSASGIENNPNDWCDEHGDEKYILKLILSCITVSLKTLDIVYDLTDVLVNNNEF